MRQCARCHRKVRSRFWLLNATIFVERDYISLEMMRLVPGDFICTDVCLRAVLASGTTADGTRFKTIKQLREYNGDPGCD